MTKVRRKIRRRNQKASEKDLEEKVGLMGQISNECLACQAPFDKSNKEQVTSWRVVVRESEKKVNLYCPQCWDSANEILNSIKKDLKNKNV